LLRGRRLDWGRGSGDRNGDFGSAVFSWRLVGSDNLRFGGSLLGGGLLDRRRRGVVSGRSVGGGGGSLLRRLLDRLDFLWLLGTGKTVTFGATTKTIGLCLDQRGGVTLHPDAHYLGECHHLLVRHSELFRELVYAHVLCQNPFQPFVAAGSSNATSTVGNSSMLMITSSNADRNAFSKGWSVSADTECFHARSNALRRAAVWKHAVEHNQAPLPAA
jgi:hypothetical protein